jgi:hypothetical protein
MALLLIAVWLTLALLLESVDVDDANGRTIQRDPWHVKSLLHKLSQCRS